MTETVRNIMADDVSDSIWHKSQGVFADGIRSYIIRHVEPAFIDDIYTLLDEQIKENLNYEDYH
jgi:rhamnogalacturonyl hydrolase YesR